MANVGFFKFKFPRNEILCDPIYHNSSLSEDEGFIEKRKRENISFDIPRNRLKKDIDVGAISLIS